MEQIKIAVIGLGYVGLPLARLFSTKYKTVGFDMNQSRVDALMSGHDATLEVADGLLQEAIRNNGFVCTTKLYHLMLHPRDSDGEKPADHQGRWRIGRRGNG